MDFVCIVSAALTNAADFLINSVELQPTGLVLETDWGHSSAAETAEACRPIPMNRAQLQPSVPMFGFSCAIAGRRASPPPTSFCDSDRPLMR